MPQIINLADDEFDYLLPVPGDTEQEIDRDNEFINRTVVLRDRLDKIHRIFCNIYVGEFSSADKERNLVNILRDVEEIIEAYTSDRTA